MNDSQTYIEMNVVTLLYLVVEQSLAIYLGSWNHLNIKRSSPGENLEEWRAALWVRRWGLASAMQQWIFFFFWPHCAVLVPQQGLNPGPWEWKCLKLSPVICSGGRSFRGVCICFLDATLPPKCWLFYIFKESDASTRCMAENNYDKESCSSHFLKYKNCRKFWVSLAWSPLLELIC